MFIGESPQGKRVGLPASDLLTHAVVLGRTGSGKSGLSISLLEEVAKSGANALVLDPKGDLTNLALSLSSEAEFAKWCSDPANERLTHGAGLAQSSLTYRDVEDWRRNVNVTIYAPGKVSGGGRPINVFPTFACPGTTEQVSRARASREVSSVLAAVGGNEDAYSPAVVFLTEAILAEWSRKRPLPIEQWPGVLSKPAEHLRSFGGMALNDFFPKGKRTALARTLIGFRHQADRWLCGEALNLAAMASRRKPEIAVFSMRHLSEEDRLFFAGLLLNKVVEFMFETEASDKLKLLVALDEARGYLPPYPYNPPTKGPICTILAQGRAQGIGMLIGTQNPMDLDYKALSNVGTWFVGRLRERDCARDLMSELASRNVGIDDVAEMPQRSFLLLDRNGGHRQFQTRWCLNYLFGPMSGGQLMRLEPGRTPVQPVFRPPPPPVQSVPTQSAPVVRVKPAPVAMPVPVPVAKLISYSEVLLPVEKPTVPWSVRVSDLLSNLGAFLMIAMVALWLIGRFS